MKPSYTYLFLTFLRIGSTSWGGFMALISMIQKKVVEKDRLMDNQAVVEGISLASVLPGPIAVNVVSFVGYKLGGIKGAAVSVAGVLLPSFLLMIALSHVYLKYGAIPAMNHFFSGVSPAVAAVIASVAMDMGTKNIKDYMQVTIALVAIVITFLSKSYLSTLGILLASGLTGYFYYFKSDREPSASSKEYFSILRPANKKYVIAAGLLTIICFALILLPGKGNGLFNLHRTISATFAGMSVSQFGGGYVIIPSMQKILVGGMKWLTDKEFTDSIAMGQITPGPIFVSATFVGYKLAGFWGAVNATLSIFCPTAVLIIICARFFNQIGTSVILTAVFKGLRPAVIGMIASAALVMLVSNGTGIIPISIFLASLVVVTRFKIDPAYVIPAAGIAGVLIF